MRPFLIPSSAMIAAACFCHTSALASDDQKRAAFDAANWQQIFCFDKWEKALITSSDPADHIADAVLVACGKEVKQMIAASRAAYPRVTSDTVKATLKDAARSRIILGRASATHQSQPQISEQKDDETEAEPKTREGKLARCARNDAEWREWAAERGHVRVDIIGEHTENMALCRAAAEKLPTAADYHASSSPAP